MPSSGSEVIQDRFKGIGKILPDNAVILYEEDEENLGWKAWMGVIFLILALTLIRLGGYEESAAEAPGHV